MAIKRADAILYDIDIREPLFDYLEERFGKTRMFEEKNIGRSRADVLMLTESQMIGLEIKSDADTYERLKKQVRNYDKYCDINYVVIGKSHEMHVEKHIPAYWGILTAYYDGHQIVIEEQREAETNPKRNQDRQLSLLWKSELSHILERNKLPKYKQKSKKFVREKLLNKLEWEPLKQQACEELFERDYSIWNDEMEKEEL